MSASVRDDDAVDRSFRRHMVFGWGAVLLFLSMGIALETMHGLKVGFLVDADHATRRFMWTLSHAHGTLLGAINILYALSLRAMPDVLRASLVSPCLIGASVLLPGGFFLGGLVTYSGDPGLGVFLTPPGGLLLLVAVGLAFWQLIRRR